MFLISSAEYWKTRPAKSLVKKPTFKSSGFESCQTRFDSFVVQYLSTPLQIECFLRTDARMVILGLSDVDPQETIPLLYLQSIDRVGTITHNVSVTITTELPLFFATLFSILTIVI